VIELNRQAVEAMNARFRIRLDAIAASYPPREPVDLDALADMISCVVDGGIIMAKVLDDPARLARQVLAYRAFIRLQFAPLPETTHRQPAMAAG
jgi:TetR/AcrR family transcriptional regulator, transcriptional repressor for nem operon